MSKFDQAQLEAGGLVSVKAKVDSKSTEPVVARRYGGDALGDRIVVRLGADRLGPAEDLTMEYLGLQSRGASKPIARQTRRALGLANWALTYHPQHARFALNLVKRIKAAARRAQAKPGHAWDDFSAMADELNESAPHFLPTYWEEAARIYKELGNQTYAGRSLNKALEAERVHALEVDRAHRRDAVLEFTLSGCLSGKALGDYAQDLQDQFEPDEAYATLRDLVVRRTLGGMAPTANMGKDLVRLAKAAGLDADAEMESVLEDIIGSPAMSRAPLQFWQSVRRHVKRIVKRNTQFAVWLLVHTNPQTRYTGDSIAWAWLDLLDDWQVLPLLWAEKLPDEPEIPGGRAGWIGRLARLESSPNKRVFELIDQMADVLKREDRPVPLFERPRWGTSFVDVDVLDAFLELGIPLSDVPEDLELNFAGWLRAEVDHPRRNAQLHHVTGDERFSLLLREKIPELVAFTGESASSHRTYGRQVAPRRSFEEAAADHPAIYDAWWQYLDGLLTRLESGGLPDAETAIAALRRGIGEKTAQRFPELPRRLQAVELVDNLHRTLTAGVLDEYGWEALEQAEVHGKLPSPSARRSIAYWMFPLVVYHRDDKLMVVQPDRADPPRELVLRKHQELMALLPVGGDVAVGYRDTSRGWSQFLFWLNDPATEYEAKDSLYWFQPSAVVAIGDGVFCGDRVVKAGDRTLPKTNPFCHDGERFWRLKSTINSYRMDDEEDQPRLVEVNPETGVETRESVPSWFENLPPGSRIEWDQSELLPLPNLPDTSPLGSRDGLIGWKVFRRRDGNWQGQGMDGRTFSFQDLDDRPYYHSQIPRAMMDQPCGSSHWVFSNAGLVVDAVSGVGIADVGGTRTTYWASQSSPIPVPFLHLMRVRHQPSSKRLRKLTRSDTEQLLAAGTVEHKVLREEMLQSKKQRDANQPANPDRTAASTAVAAMLPQAPPQLVAGVARIARLCAEEQISLDKLRAALQPQAKDTKAEGRLEEPGGALRIEAGLLQLQIPKPTESYYRLRDDANLQQHLREVTLFLQAKREGTLPPCSLPWLNLLRDLPGLAWKCFWRLGTIEGQHATIHDRLRQPWLDALEFLANSGMLDLPGRFRLHTCQFKERKRKLRFDGTSEKKEGIPTWVQGENRFLRQSFAGYLEHIAHILEYAPHGEFQAPQGFDVEATEEAPVYWNGQQLQEFIDSVRQVTELPLATAEQLATASRELGVTEVEVAIIWMGNLRTVDYGQEKLTKELRSHYGWKVKQLQEAIAAIEANPVPPEVISAPVRHCPSCILPDQQAGAFDALVATWKQAQKDTVRLAPELIALLDKSGPRYHRAPTETFIRLLTERADSPLLQPRRLEFRVNEERRGHREIVRHFTPPGVEESESLWNDLPLSIRLIHYAAPAGDPARRALPGLIDAARQYLDDPMTVLPFGLSWATEDLEKFVADEIIARFSQALGKFDQGSDGIHRCDDGLVVGALLPPYVALVFRPARLKDEDAFMRLVSIAGLTHGWYGEGVEFAHSVRELRGDAMTRIAELNRDPPFEGYWDQDPRRSAAKTIKAVRKHLKVDEDSAAVYLQLLALPDPTNANICKWNDWSSKQLKAAVAPLLAAGHLVEAKRARAGRNVFLPGGWQPLKAPNLPIESWKLPLLGIEAEDLGAVRYQLIVPHQPAGDLFAAAWQRVESGDRPRYGTTDQ